MSLLLALTAEVEPEVQLRIFGGDAEWRKKSRYEPGGSYWLERLKEVEPEIAEVIEVQAVSAVETPDAQIEMRQALDNLGFAYKQAYQEIYLELVAEMRQAQEDEQIAAVVASML